MIDSLCGRPFRCEKRQGLSMLEPRLGGGVTQFCQPTEKTNKHCSLYGNQQDQVLLPWNSLLCSISKPDKDHNQIPSDPALPAKRCRKTENFAATFICIQFHLIWFLKKVATKIMITICGDEGSLRNPQRDKQFKWKSVNNFHQFPTTLCAILSNRNNILLKKRNC